MLWDNTRYMGFDFEASGSPTEFALQPWRIATGGCWATSLVWITRAPDGTWDRIGGGLNPTVDMMREMLETAIREERVMVGWNTLYDMAILIAYGLYPLVRKLRWLDGMLLWRHAAVEPEYGHAGPSKKSFALKGKDGKKGCVEELWPDEAGFQEGVDFHDPSPEMRAKLHAYNIDDVKFTLRGAQHWWDLLDPKQQRVARMEAACLPMVAAANVRGMPIDSIYSKGLSAALNHEANDRATRLSLYGFDEVIAASPKKLAALLFDTWGLRVIKHNPVTPAAMLKAQKKGEPPPMPTRSTDKETLHELGLEDVRVRAVQEYRSCQTNQTKFPGRIVESADYNADGCVHPLAKVFATYSGRLTYSSKQGKNKDERPIGYAHHQMNRKSKFRRSLVAPPGRTMVEFDAAGQEFRWMAEASRDLTMRHLCRKGEDPHSYLGAKIAHCDYDDLKLRSKVKDSEGFNQRMLGKVGNLSLQYRTSAARLLETARVDYLIPMLMHEAETIRETYRVTYPEVPNYWSRQISQTKSSGYVETLAGRRIKVVGDWRGSNGWAMGSTAINYRIQGTGADQKYLALACIEAVVEKYDAWFAFDLHDGIYFYVPDEHVEAFCEAVKKILDDLPYKQAWGFTPSIPLPWDCKKGPTWGELKEFEI